MNRRKARRLEELWERVQGKWHVKRICNDVFNEYANDKQLLVLDNLEVAMLRVYNSLNKQLLGPHKQPPSASAVHDIIENYRRTKNEINKDEFYELILEWTRKDLRIYAANKIIFALLLAPSLAFITKDAGKRVPRIGHIVEKIPSAVLFSGYSAGLVFFIDRKAK